MDISRYSYSSWESRGIENTTYCGRENMLHIKTGNKNYFKVECGWNNKHLKQINYESSSKRCETIMFAVDRKYGFLMKSDLERFLEPGMTD